MPTRRQFLKGISAAAVAAAWGGRLRAGEDEVRVSILHTTDLHGNILPTSTYEGEGNVGGLARCATQIRAWREENRHSLLLDVGDVFQGTEIGFRTKGGVMLDCFRELGYDAWTVGNHEFDWGIDAFRANLDRSPVPVLSANAVLDGGPSGSGGWEKVKPWILRDVGGIKIGVIGLTTPGLPYWFQPSFTAGFEAADPAEVAVRAAKELSAEGADAIVLSCHMGMRPSGDDYANRIDAVTRAVPHAAVVLCGHTHREIPSAKLNGALVTQANYYGIHAGKVDLVFDRASRRLVRAEAQTKKMGAEIPLDPAILSLAAKDIEESARILAAPAGILAEEFPAERAAGKPGAIERLIATAIGRSLAGRGVKVDGVLHGTFLQTPLPAGPKTVGDAWKIVPYENFVMTGELTPPQLARVLEESFSDRKKPVVNLMGLRPQFDGSGRVTAIAGPGGEPLDPGLRVRIAMNTYDASSAGQRLPALREILRETGSRATLHPTQTREAVISLIASAKEPGLRTGDLISG